MVTFLSFMGSEPSPVRTISTAHDPFFMVSLALIALLESLGGPR